MELVAEYRQLLNEQRRAEAELLKEERMKGSWEQFHESDAKFISVFAARRSGKSYNLALRALRSRRDCTIFSNGQYQAIQMKDMIMSLSANMLWGATVARGNGGYTIRTDGRVIRIESRFTARGERYTGEEVMIDEFDRNLIDIEYIARTAERVICVGTPITQERNAAKRWFAESELKIFIDSSHDEEGYSLLESSPSSLTDLLAYWAE
jgi:hypothetical protein